MKRLISAIALGMALAALPALAAEATFERTLSVSGAVTLHVSTGSGNIHIRQGSDDKVHIFGRVKSGWGGGGEERVKEVAAHPPIEQTGSIIRVGAHMDGFQHVSIDYEIEAPAKAFLEATTGSGNVDDDGVGVNARLNTGSGNITAHGLAQSFTVETGSGNIYAEQTGTGDVKANTGSGNIELKSISGGLRAETGSGDIKVNGQPKTGWRLTTGSGGVDLSTEHGAMTIEASTGSGSIHVDEDGIDRTHEDKHSLSAKVRGGGPMVRVETGSGDIRIH